MRYENGHKEATREKILVEAARRFREEGIDAVGVANLMGGIGLTQGGFYNHFQSKDALAREAMTNALEATTARFEKDGSVVALVERYNGKTQGDKRAEDGLRPQGERSIYFFDLDNNRVQLTAHAPNQSDELLQTMKNGAALSPTAQSRAAA